MADAPVVRTVSPLPPPPPPAVAPVVPVAPAVTVEPLAAIPPLALPSRPLQRDEVRAALLVPLSGSYAGWGTALSNAAQLALFDVADERFNLIPLDTKGTPEGAVAATRQALAQGADVVIGPLFSAEVKAAAPVAREQMVPMLAFTTDRAALGNGVYTLGFLPEPQVRRVVAQAMSEGRTRFAALAPNTDSGRAFVDALKAAVLAAGARLVKLDYYDPHATDLTPQIKRFVDYEHRKGALERERRILMGRSDAAALAKLEGAPGLGDAPFDALLLADDGQKVRSIASLVTYFGIDPGPVRILGTMQWDDPKLNDEPALAGAWYPAPPMAQHAEFEARYTKAFGAMPARVGNIASLAYDATALAAALARQGQGEYATAALTSGLGFAGVDGIFRLRADGTTERGLSVKELARGGAKEVSPAPATFAP
ncbi:MAG: penicillin-binding protein activator [Magnetospirillum sp.]|nr:penicillin-binding protein activator [Magnetospirillum sp.]